MEKKTRKVGIEAFISDGTKQAGDAIAKAARGHDKMMRGYEKAMKGAAGMSCPDAAYRAAFGAMHGAGYSEARRAAEMLRATLIPDLTQHAKEITEAARQISEFATGALREMDFGMNACHDAIEAIVGPTKNLETSLTRDVVSNFEAFKKSFDLGPAFDAAAIRRIDEFQESMHTALASLPDLTERPIALLRPPVRQETHNPTAQFMASFKQHYDEAVSQAAEQDGVVVVFTKTSAGDPILVKEMTSLDQYFIQVTGIDQYNQPCSFKANCSGLALQIEIVPIPEGPEDHNHEDDEVDEVVN